MENWEEDHIRKNLPDLLKNTRCSPDFLSLLGADGTLGNADIDTLNCIGNRLEQVQKFYEIVKTRRGSYNKLRDALVATSQTGASEILDRCNRNNATNPFKNYGTITYDPTKVIGHGSYNTTVYRGEFENRIVAVKVISTGFVDAATALKQVDVLTKLDGHDNVVRYYKTEVTKEFVLIAFELCHSNLRDWVIKPRTIEIGVAELLKQITEGIKYLHFKRVVHRDLKPANILLMNLVGGRVYVKISDFGLSRKISDGKSRLSKHSGVGTEGWLAPEVAQQMDDEASSDFVLGMSLASDIFALGCIFYFVLSKGVHPFGGPVKRQANILDGKHKLDPEKMTALQDKALGFIWLIRHMLAHKEAERPTASDILSHHTFWSSRTTLHFLEDVYPFIDACSEMINRSFLLVAGQGTSQDLSSLFCPVLTQFLKDLKNISVGELTLAQVLQLLIGLRKDQFNLPTNVKSVLGRNADEFLSYWESRFPYLLPVGWTCFQYVKENNDTIHQYYQSDGSKFRFRLVRRENESFSIKPFPNDKVPGALTENSRDYSLLESNMNDLKQKADKLPEAAKYFDPSLPHPSSQSGYPDRNTDMFQNKQGIGLEEEETIGNKLIPEVVNFFNDENIGSVDLQFDEELIHQVTNNAAQTRELNTHSTKPDTVDSIKLILDYKAELQKYIEENPSHSYVRLQAIHLQVAEKIIHQVTNNAAQTRELHELLERNFKFFLEESWMNLNWQGEREEEVAIGIHLGTVNSVTGVYLKGKVQIIQSPLGETNTPSCIAFFKDKEGRMKEVFGKPVQNLQCKDPQNTVHDVKRLIGRKMTDKNLHRAIKNMQFPVVDNNGLPQICVSAGSFSPEEISGKLLAEFKRVADKYLKVPIKKAVITVPAYFNDDQRRATHKAEELAGFQVLQLLNEPTAAAIAYKLQRWNDKAKKVVIFGLGGGTFDVAVLDVGNTIKVQSVGWDAFLEGLTLTSS